MKLLFYFNIGDESFALDTFDHYKFRFINII